MGFFLVNHLFWDTLISGNPHINDTPIAINQLRIAGGMPDSFASVLAMDRFVKLGSCFAQFCLGVLMCWSRSLTQDRKHWFYDSFFCVSFHILSCGVLPDSGEADAPSKCWICKEERVQLGDLI